VEEGGRRGRVMALEENSRPTLETGLETGGRWPQAKEWGRLLEAGKSKEGASSLEPVEGNVALLTPCF